MIQKWELAHFAEPCKQKWRTSWTELLLKGDLVAGSTLKIGVKAGQLKFDIA